MRRSRIRRGFPWFLGLVALLGVALTSVEGAPVDAPPFPGIGTTEAWPGVRFTNPVGLVHAGDGTEDLYVIEQAGVIKRLEKWRGSGPVPQPAAFLDIRDRIFSRLQGGLLGLAFHPTYKTNGRFFVAYLAGQQGAFRVVVSEFRSEGGAASPASERKLLEAQKTLALHNGGWLAFGPKDGMLYVSIGDNDGKPELALQTSQDPRSLVGKILRIDIDKTSPGLAYAIPPDNPWAGVQNVRQEIWAYGMRHPWRFSFDQAGTLWTSEPGTKGPGCREWVIKVQKAGNHRWPYFEGTRPMVPGTPTGTPVLPFFEYERGPDPDVTSAIGGYVYRGTRMPQLKGWYIWPDYSRGSTYGIMSQGTPQQIAQSWRKLAKVKGVASLGEDAQGELYLVSYDQGLVYTFRGQ